MTQRFTKSLPEVVQTIALLSTLTEREKDQNVVTLSTLHAAKGLEWLHVMLVGVTEGLAVGSLRSLERNLLKWTNRAVRAKHWWERFLNAPDADSAFAAWHVFLSASDRRAWVWRPIRSAPQSELDRLLELHLPSNTDLYSRTLNKAEQSAAKFADKRPMLDGAAAR